MTIKPLPSALPLAGWVNQTILSRYNPCTRECTSSYSKEKMTWQQGRRALMTLCHCQPELSPIPSLWLALIALKLLAQEAKITNSTETNTAWCHNTVKLLAQTCLPQSRCGTNTNTKDMVTLLCQLSTISNLWLAFILHQLFYSSWISTRTFNCIGKLPTNINAV